MSVLLTGPFWAAAGERAVKTFAQAMLACFGTQALGVLDIDWGQAFSIAGLAAAASILGSVASAPAGNNGPSLTTEKVVEKNGT